MKILCYFGIFVAFMLFYQKDPFFTIIILVISVGVYLFFKSRKNKKGFFGAFLSGRANTQDNQIDDLITLMILQQMFSNSNSNYNSNETTTSGRENPKREDIDKIKDEILTLLESD